MSDDHIGVKVNGVLYVRLEDARKLREGWDEADKHIEAQAAEITRLRAELATALEKKKDEPTMTEEQLREMMLDPRYWRQRNPEWVKRVTAGFRALVGGKKDE